MRTGGPADAPATLALLDAAVAWLVSLGRTGQWGERPWTSNPKAVERTESYARDHLLRVAEDGDGHPVGICVLAEEKPEYAPAAGEPELYVRLLVTDRARKGTGVGAALIADAIQQTRGRGFGLLRVDCYAGDDRRLVGQYERLGFTATDAFEVEQPGGPWPGRILEIRV
ncbi:GNAT family N-acetyltransferase [Kitasatospora sp. NPDC094015]|uniref:GNAT family N-acetyltransferase n=1 Tax=Kitasatospora sp. NPDC094015 TaxID=3155205 RepID=UPI003330C92F